jgi:hypothetical protein
MPEIKEGSFELNLGIVKLGAKLSEDDRQCAWELYSEAMAPDAFTEISRACEYLIAARIPSMAPEYYAMATGIVTLYGRPFAWRPRLS